ncbi:MAG TPA: EF-hand domain-containing protein [Salinivirgaceae bacterium]|nr:EF-hand domain-containing protein [Salinivirgaceae bacterium]
MRTNFLIILLFFIFTSTQQSFAQQIDEDYEAVLLSEDDDASTDLFSSAFKPIFGLGQGILTFYGDIRNNYESPLNGKWGTSVSISRSLGRYFDVDLYALFGKTSGERRSLEDISLNKNFETEIFIGGVSGTYNFNHIFKRKRPIHPFISLGIETMQFKPRGDMEDKNGNPYFYTSDGTIRNLNNNIITRDYTYETNLREVNPTNKDYSLMTFTIPVDLGLNITITDRLTLRVANSLKIAFSDYIDDTEGTDGLIKNDILNYSYVSLRLDLFSPASEIAAVEQFKNLKFIVTDGEDEDGDGVDDFNDECPGTKAGVVVDYRGCPIDSDDDGVPDYMDEQPNTPADAIGVGPTGVRFTTHHLIAILFDPKAVDRKELTTYYHESMHQKTRKKYDKMPEKFKQVDTNNDGWISPAEMRQAIDKVFDFKSNLTVEDVNELLEYFWVQ